MSARAAQGLRLGPLVRWVDPTRATVWVETEHPGEVEVLGSSSPTFTVAGHHFALVLVDGLEPGTSHRYEVRVDGRPVWPPAGWGYPPSVVTTLPEEPTLRLTFGSCRVVGPRTAPLHIDRILRRYDPDLDALLAFAERMRESDPSTWPDQLLLLGDQVYADDIPESTREAMLSRRGSGATVGSSVEDWEDYTRLYLDSWSEEPIRWLLSTVPTAMIFDDHELVDNWDVSAAWVAEKRATPGWDERLTGALMSYWVYQHLGNLAPEELEQDRLYREVRAEDDGAERLRAFIREVDADHSGSRWAYRRDYGETRLIVIDSRATRVLRDGHRGMLDPAEWTWLEANLPGARHLLLATSVPVFYALGFHHLQAWSERLVEGAWGRRGAVAAERLQRSLSLSGWPAFHDSFERLTGLLHGLARGDHGEVPESITILSGDVHHGYVARVEWPDEPHLRTPVHQVVTSPFRNPLMPHERWGQRLAASRVGGAALAALSQAAGAGTPALRWHRLEGIDFANQVSTLRVDRDVVELTSEGVRHGDRGVPGELYTMWRRRLA